MDERREHLRLSRKVPPPHGGADILVVGTPLDEARAAMVLVHGRGATADDLLGLREEWSLAGLTLVAPQAAEFTWYPRTFLAPLEQNEPHLSSGLVLLGAIVDELGDRGIPAERQILVGFSQGGCLVLEFAGRFARRRGGVAGLSAGLIGPPGRQWNFSGSLEKTPVFLGCSDTDPHIPRGRVEESAAELKRIGGEVELRIYPGLGHTVNRDELAHVQRMIDRVSGYDPAGSSDS
ncbi:MAG TPA: dienelactone hydrolase family protein [Candidatus Eisenbacteria bacterium]